MKVMITGAQFNNKGAQSLLFVLIDKLKKEYPDVKIFYLPVDDYRKYKKDKYNFKIIYGDMEAHYYENIPIVRPLLVMKAYIRRIVKNSTIKVEDVRMLHKILPQLDVIIDISGYQLTSNFSNIMNRRFLYYIEEAKRYSKKIILMPQSFGPFNYSEAGNKIMKLIGRDLRNADLIFVREKEGLNLLKKSFDLKNLYLSPDIVLQSDEIDWSNIYTEIPKFNYPKLTTSNNVAIIPNVESFKHGNDNIILTIYHRVIEQLLAMKKNVYIFRHSHDLPACERIYRDFKVNDCVHLIKDELECAEYSKFIKQFDYIIASRYHSVVHAYKECVPAVIFGWAVKYLELAEIFEQSKYVFDITKEEIDLEQVFSAIIHMESYYNEESKLIKNKALGLRANNCFEICWQEIEKTNDF